MSEARNLERYDRLLQNLDHVSSVSDEMKNEIMNINIEDLKIESNIDVYDFVFASVFGILGATISTSDKIETFTDKIHDLASGKSVSDANGVQTLLGNLLRHNGDAIDSAFLEDGGRAFLNRQGNGSGPFMHRLLRGHDPLSMAGDNPFKVLCLQYGFTKGVTQTLRHLIADTFSKEGLPIPGHSFFDVTRFDGRVSNYFIEVSKNLTRQSSKADMRSVYEGLFTIQAKDIASQGLVWALCKGYFHFRGIEDSTRQRQIRIMSYGMNFFTHAGFGMVRQGGIPYIHWPALVMLSKEFAGMYLDSYKEIRELENRTLSLVNSDDELEKRVFETGRNIKTIGSADDYFQQVKAEKNAFDDLTDFFEED